jgi:signal transduction histidine kinase
MAVHVAALSGLIDDLFELSRLEAGEITWSLRQVDLATLVGDTVDALEAEARAKGVRMRTRVPEDLPPARANPEKLQRVLFNLIHNAIRHTPADGSVAVLAEPDEAGLVVEVADTGEGIPPVDRERCSSRFPGRRPHRPRGRGSGWPSPAGSSRPTAGGSGWRTRPAASGCASACR